jgi:hypothetical protein
VVLAIGLDLGKKLYEKGIDYAGGALLQDIFKEPQPINVQEFISEAVTSIESKIAGLEAKIDEQNLNRMRSDLDSIKYSFAEYAALDPGLREANRNLLLHCDTASAGLLSLSMRYEQAFFLSTAVLAYRLLTRFALFQLDSSSGVNAQGHVTSLVSSGEMKSYFQSATQSRARLVGSLAPQYAFSCSRHQELLPFATPKTECDVLRANVKISKTNVMSWGSESDQSAQHIYQKTNQSALAYVYNLPTYKSDHATWSSVLQKSAEQILLGADCMDRMYYAASRLRCPPQFNRGPLETQFSFGRFDRFSLLRQIEYAFLSCQTEASGIWRCKVPP